MIFRSRGQMHVNFSVQLRTPTGRDLQACDRRYGAAVAVPIRLYKMVAGGAGIYYQTSKRIGTVTAAP